jgi:phosphate/sulfate permease
MGTSVGSKSITIGQAMVLAGICEFCGSMMGGGVAHTISHGIVSPQSVGDTALYVKIMFCTLTGSLV